MKSILATTIFLFGTGAFACPNLTGHYICSDWDRNGNPIQVPTTISQLEANGITTYTWTTPEYTYSQRADGIRHEYPDEAGPTLIVYTESLACNGNSMDQLLTRRETDAAGNEVSYAEVNRNYSLDAANNILKVYDVFSQGQKYSFQGTCTRL